MLHQYQYVGKSAVVESTESVPSLITIVRCFFILIVSRFESYSL